MRQKKDKKRMEEKQTVCKIDREGGAVAERRDVV
jgi:hypothetical protein